MTSLLVALTLSSGLAHAECPLDLEVRPRVALDEPVLVVHGTELSVRVVHLPQTRRVLEACGYGEAADLLQTWKRGTFGAAGLAVIFITAEVAVVVLAVAAQLPYYEPTFVLLLDELDWPGEARDALPGAIEDAWEHGLSE